MDPAPPDPDPGYPCPAPSEKGPLRLAGQEPPGDVEVDVWWGGYSPRTMVPSLALCAVLSLLIGGGALYLWYVHDLPAWEVRYPFYGVVGAIWLGQLLLLGYRVVFFNYRLTTRHLFREHGPRRTSDGRVDLASISGVRVWRGPIERLLDVGRIIVMYQDNGRKRLVLEGVARPYRVLAKIRRRVERARRKG